MESNSAEVLKRDGWFRIHTSSDFMEAILELEAPLGDGKWPVKTDAMEALRSEGVCYGILEEVIDRLVERRSGEPVVVAKGKPPVPGVDAEIKLLFEVGEILKMFESDDSGKVDYRNIQTIQSVKTGEVLAQKIPATPGEPGQDVYGRPIAPQAGKDKQVKLGKNVVWTQDNLKVVSKIEGEPSLVNNQINVYSVHEVQGDVNLKSGNISFFGSLVIRGNIDSGFRVEAEGDITVHGCVEAADIKAGGNVIVRGGITGRDKCNITCNGDFTAKYIEYAKVDCGGNVTVKEAIMQCEVNSNGRVVVELGKGLIVGGVIRAGEDIAAKTIGSKFGTTTELEAGVRPKLKIEYQQLETLLATNKENLDKAEKAVAILEKMPCLPPERQEMYRNLRKTVDTLKIQNCEAELRRKNIMEEMLVLSKGRGRVRVKEILFPGTRVNIAGAMMIVKDELKYLSMVYGEGEVKIQSYR